MRRAGASAGRDVQCGLWRAPKAAAPLARTDAHEAYLKDNASGYEWFANASDGYGGVPLVLLRSLPDLAPEIWGKPEEQFAKFGYIPNPNGPLPLGLSWDSMDKAVKPQPLHPVALTCGACHIGRVKLDDGRYRRSSAVRIPSSTSGCGARPSSSRPTST